MKNPLLFGLMAILLLGGTITPAISQNSPELKIVINEVELNPTGSDAGIGVGGSGVQSKLNEGSSGAQEYVELYNPTTEEVDISGWSIVPSASWKALEIPNGTIIEPESFLAFTHVNFWFKDFGETITLIDELGNVIDETPLLKDQDDNGNSWQRSTDGFDTDSASNWELKRMTPKSSNGKIIQTEETSFSLTVGTDNNEFVFGETVTISGTISEKLYTVLSSPEIIKINIQGPNYFKNLALFPDRDLNFETTFILQQVLGFKLGDYTIDVSYGDNSSSTTFSIIDELESTSESKTETLEIFTDKESYIPGETVILQADVTSSIEFGGLDYTVTNPNGITVFEGTIFPNERFSTVYQAGAGQIYPFSTQLFMGTVNPVYGVYEISGTFKSQDDRTSSFKNLSTTASFSLIEDVKENVAISISTDQSVYSVGDIIKITGRSNDYWVPTLNLQVLQTGLLKIESRSTGQIQQADPFTLNDSVRVNGDGTFEYEFKVVKDATANDDYSHAYGDYKITASEYFGEGNTYFKIVEDPESFIDIRTPLGLISDKSGYSLGNQITFSGKIAEYEPTGNQATDYVEITFKDPTGKVMMSADRITNANDYGKSPNEKFSLRAKPDLVGVFSTSMVLVPIQFDYGKYTVTAEHPNGKITESIEFEIKSAESDIIEETTTEEPLTINLCKSESAYTKDILNDLRRIGKGEIPPSMKSVTCDDNLDFKVGDKLVVTGKVIPRTGVELDQSSTKTSAQTQGGSSYSTNYAEAMMNYVEVSIPYPYSMTVSGAASVQTIPNEGENYTGGGGSGGGGVMQGGEDGAGTGIYGRNDGGESDPNRHTGYNAQIILKNQKLLLTEMNYKAYPDEEGNFATVFELRAGIFGDGVYAVKANYFGYYEETSVRITDNSLKGGSNPSIAVNLEKDEFVPGETVKINGLIENVYYYDNVSVKVEAPNVSQINCFEGHQCGFGAEKKLRVQEGVNGPAFNWNYKIPESSNAIGNYKIVVDTHFGQFEKHFFVVDESEIIGKASPPEEASAVLSKKIIQKFNRISDSEIPITLGEKSSEESSLVPRVLQGSLFTSARGEESDVNLRIITSGGQCVVGQSSDCLVTESTRKPGAIYSIVSIDDVDYKIRYSGNDVRLEKFSIVPADSGSQIDIDNWNVEIIKDEQPSRFYYKVSYIALE